MTAASAAAIDEDPPPKKPPKFCPWCGSEVFKRWVPNRIPSLHTRPGTHVVYVCFGCKVGVRAFVFPSRPLFVSKKAAHVEAQRDYDDLESSGFSAKYLRDRYERGKCSCSPPYGVAAPCPIHNPLRKRRRA